MKYILLTSLIFLIPTSVWASSCTSERFMEEIAGPEIRKYVETRFQGLDNIRKDNHLPDTERALADRSSRVTFYKNMSQICNKVMQQCFKAGLKHQTTSSQISWCNDKVQKVIDYEVRATQKTQFQAAGRQGANINEATNQTKQQTVSDKLNRSLRNLVRVTADFAGKFTRLIENTQIPEQKVGPY